MLVELSVKNHDTLRDSLVSAFFELMLLVFVFTVVLAAGSEASGE